MELVNDEEVIDKRTISTGMRYQRLGVTKKGANVISMKIIRKIVRIADVYSNDEVTDRQRCFWWPRGGAMCRGEYIVWCSWRSEERREHHT